MRSCRFSDQSRADIRAITHTIKNDNPRAAAQWLSTIQEKCQRIASFPHVGRERNDLRAGLLSFPHGNYFIFYRVIPTGIEIARVLDGRRDIPALFRELPAGGVEAPEFAELGTAYPRSDR